jgi:hypothetical protein
MGQTFVTLQQVYKAALTWYGKTDMDSLCLTENRLNKGEKPEGCNEIWGN